MRTVALAAGCAALVIACGDGASTASGRDGFCAGAERLDAANQEFDSILRDLVQMVDRTASPDEEALGEATEMLLRVGDLTEEMLDAIDGMIAGADGDVRRDLEAIVEYNRPLLTPLIEAESADDIGAALDGDTPDPPPGIAERARRIDDATQEQCGVAFLHNPFEAVVEAATDGPTPWPDVDVCALLPVEALTEAGVVDTEGTADDGGPPNIEQCEWGERYAVDGTYLQLSLWDPPFPQVFEDFWEVRGEVAGRTMYVESARVRELTCRLAIDNGAYVITATIDLEEAQGDDDACQVAEGAAASALSSLSSG
ncbi:MAG: hypothetical protein ACRD2C_00085 [Acidimicrobiales bacterium]